MPDDRLKKLGEYVARKARGTDPPKGATEDPRLAKLTEYVEKKQAGEVAPIRPAAHPIPRPLPPAEPTTRREVDATLLTIAGGAREESLRGRALAAALAPPEVEPEAEAAPPLLPRRRGPSPEDLELIEIARSSAMPRPRGAPPAPDPEAEPPRARESRSRAPARNSRRREEDRQLLEIVGPVRSAPAPAEPPPAENRGFGGTWDAPSERLAASMVPEEEDPSQVAAGFRSGLKSVVPSLLGRGAETIGNAWGWDSLVLRGRRQAARGDAAAEENAPRVRGLEEIRSFDDAIDWAAYQFGQGSASMAPIIAGAATGAAAGSVVPGIGTAVGGATGGLVAGITLGMGTMRKALEEEGVTNPEALDALASIGGAAIGALDAITPTRILGRAAGAEAPRVIARSLIRRVAQEGGLGSLTEGVTEAGQFAIERGVVSGATDAPLLTGENALGLLENALAGVIVGGPLGAAGGVAPDVEQQTGNPADERIARLARAMADGEVGAAAQEGVEHEAAPISEAPSAEDDPTSDPPVPDEAPVAPENISAPEDDPNVVRAAIVDAEMGAGAGEPERITGAAVRLGDRHYTGTDHAEAIHALLTDNEDLLPESGRVDDFDPQAAGVEIELFETSRGRLVGRDEAREVARASNQIRPDTTEELHAESIRYGVGREEPSPPQVEDSPPVDAEPEKVGSPSDSEAAPEPGAPLDNGFFAGPSTRPGERFRVSPNTTVRGVLFEKRSAAGRSSSFYVGKDGGLIDSDNVVLNNAATLEPIWKPESEDQRAAAAEVLQQMGALDLSDPARAGLKDRLREIVAGATAPTRQEEPPAQPPAEEPARARAAEGVKPRPAQETVEGTGYLIKGPNASLLTDRQARNAVRAADLQMHEAAIAKLEAARRDPRGSSDSPFQLQIVRAMEPARLSPSDRDSLKEILGYGPDLLVIEKGKPLPPPAAPIDRDAEAVRKMAPGAIRRGERARAQHEEATAPERVAETAAIGEEARRRYPGDRASIADFGSGAENARKGGTLSEGDDPAFREGWEWWTERQAGQGAADESSTYGAGNKVFTKDAADAARERLKAKLSGKQLNTGLDPELLIDAITIGGYHAEAGAREFAAWSQQMVDDVGEGVRPYLRSIYSALRTWPGFDSAGMTPEAEIEAGVRPENAPAVDSAPAPAQTEPEAATPERGTDDAETGADDRAPAVEDAGGGDPAGEGSGAVREPEGGRRAPGVSDPDERAGADELRNAGEDDRGAESGTGELGPAGRGGEGDSGRAGSDDVGGEPTPARDPKRIRGRDYKLTPETLENLGGPKTRARQNMAAIRILRQLEEERRPATREEQDALAKYVGWGGLKDMFPTQLRPWEVRFVGGKRITEEYKPEWEALGQDLKELLTEEEYATAKRSTQYAHYTSHEVIGAIYSALTRLGVSGPVRALEAGAGVGNFIGLSPLSARWTAVEMDHTSSAILKALYPSANLYAEPYQNVTLSDGTFDVAVGNPPFGDINIADRRYGKRGLLIHDYFFTKSLDKLREGGILAYVTSTGTMDKASRGARQAMADRADFLGAVRLPGTAFQKNAGTEVTTDILFFQKREKGTHPAHRADWMALAEVDGFKINEFFVAHPKQILGEIVADKLHPDRAGVAARKDEDLAAALEVALEQLPTFVYVRPGAEHLAEQERSDDVPEGAMPGQYVLHKGEIAQVKGGRLVPLGVDASSTTGARVAKLVELGEAARAVLLANRPEVSDADLQKAQKRLGKLYDAFVKKYGPINKKLTSTTSKGTITERRPNLLQYNDPVNGPLVVGLERYDEETGKASRTAIFDTRLYGTDNPLGTIDTAWKAVVASLVEHGRIEMPYLEEIYGKSEVDIVAELGEKLFLDPHTGLYETPERYLSGNVREKLAVARDAAATNPRFQPNVDALEKAQPEDVTVSQMRKMGATSFGVTWIPTDAYSSFVREVLGMDAEIVYREIDGKYSVRKGAIRNNATYQEWSTSRAEAIDLIRDLLNGSQTRVTDPREVNGKRVMVEDKEASAAAERKKVAIQSRFDAWVFDDNPERAAAYNRRYNETMNHTVLAEWDGEHLRGRMPGMATVFRGRPLDLAKHQLNVIWRYLTNGNTLMAHEVGAGKTIAMIAMSQEAKRMGLVRKPMFAVPNSMLGQFSREFLEVYPGAKILVADDHQFHTSRRREFLARVAADEWDAVILTHSAIGMIETTPKFQSEILGRMLAEFEEALIAAQDSGEDRFTVKALERAKEKYEEKIAALTQSTRRDSTVYWEDLGIDLLFVDEAHEYKNLSLPSTGPVKLESADKTMDMYVKTRHLERVNPGRGIVFATATPISNSIAEMYVMMRYLMEDRLRAEGYPNFDAWANNFVSSWAEQEFTAIGTMEEKHRPRAYRNSYAMAQQFRTVADVKMAKDLNLPTPPLIGGAPEIIVVPGSARLKAFMRSLQRRWDSRPKKPEKGDDGVFPVMNDGRFGTIDARLVTSRHAAAAGHDASQPWEKSKAEYAAKRVYEIWKETKEVRGTQMVFSDLGVPKAFRKGDAVELRAQLAEQHSDLTDAELDALVEQVLGQDDYDIYNDLKDRLVAMGVPAKEIAFIQEAQGNKKKKQQIIDRTKSGQVRVLIGSTPMMGQGVNAQDRMVALHHLDVPYKPAWLQQRDGRIVRQGNLLWNEGKIDGVRVIRYALQGSYDPRAWQILENKIGFIEQGMTARADTGMVEEVGGNTLSTKDAYAIIKAEASDNPYAMDHAMAQGKLKALRGEQEEHRYKRNKYERQISEYKARVRGLHQRLADAEKDIKRLVNAVGEDFRVRIRKKEYTDPATAGNLLLEEFDEISLDEKGNKKGQAVTDLRVGEYGGLKLSIGYMPWWQTPHQYVLEGAGRYEGFPNVRGRSPEGIITTLENMLDRIRGMPESIREEIARLEQEAAATEELSREPFPRMEDLNEATRVFNELDAKMQAYKGGGAEEAETTAEPDDDPELEDDPEDAGFAAATADTPAFLRARAEAVGMPDPKLLSTLERAKALAKKQPGRRVLKDRIRAFSEVAAERGLIEAPAAPRARRGRSAAVGMPEPDRIPTRERTRAPADPLAPGGAPAPSGLPIARNLSGRLEIPPVSAKGKPVSAPDVIHALGRVAQAAGREIPQRIGRISQRSALGIFKVREEVIRVVTANDIPTSAHEIAHALEKILWGWSKGGPWKKPRVSTKIQRELVALGKALYGDKTPAGGYKREGWAEFVRLWLTTEEAQEKAPELHRWFEDEFASGFPEVRSALLEARDLAARWRDQGSQARAKASIIDPASPRARLERAAQEVRGFFTMENLVEMAQPFAEVDRAAEEKMGRALDPVESLFFTTSALRMVHASRARVMVEVSMIDPAGNVVGGSLDEIRPLVKGRQKEFTVYLWAKRAVRLWTDKRGARNPGLSLEDAYQIIRDLDSPEFQLAAGKVYEWNDGVMSYAAQSSPTFAAVVEKVRERDPGNYIPLQREFDVLDEMWSASKKLTGSAKRGNLVKRLEGSGRRIKDPFPVMIAKAESTLRAAHERVVIDQMVKLSQVEGLGHLIEKVPVERAPVARQSIEEILDEVNRRLVQKGAAVEVDDGGQDLDLAGEMITFFAQKQQPDGQDPIIPIWQNGKVQWYQVDAELYKVLATLDVYRLPKIAEVFIGKPAAMFRAGTTGLRASFGLLWNPFRDFQTLYTNTRSHAAAPRLFMAWLQSAGELALYHTTGKRSPYVDAFVRLGGEMAQPLGQDIPHTRRAARRLFEGRVVRTLDPRNWYDLYRDVVQFPEAAPRVAELRLMAKEIGWRPGQPMTMNQSMQLLLAAKQVTTDFTAAGEFARFWNRVAPFFNSAIQGPRASVRAAKHHPARFAARGLQFAWLTLLLWWMNKDEDWYKELDYRDKFLHWHFPVTINGREELIRLPRNFEIGAFFMALPEMLADAWYSNDPEQAKAWFSTLLETSTPNMEPVLLAEVLDQVGNKDRFWETPIVPMGEQRRPAEEQYNEYTSRAAIKLGEVFNRSPRRIDHAIEGLFGPVGGDLLGVLGLGAKGVEREKELADLPIVGRAFQRGGAGGTQPRSVREMYSMLEEAQKRQASVRSGETPEQRLHRLQLEDAAKAIQALYYVRSQTPGAVQRRALTKEIGTISAEAVGSHEEGRLARPKFQRARKAAERQEEIVKRTAAR